MNDEASKTQPGEKYLVRFPDGMRDRVAEAAKANNRSMNAEIVARLQASFGSPSTALPPELKELVEGLADDQGLSFQDALEQAIVAGTNASAPQVIRVTMRPGTTAADFALLFTEARKHISPDATVIVERESHVSAEQTLEGVRQTVTASVGPAADTNGGKFAGAAKGLAKRAVGALDALGQDPTLKPRKR